MPTEKPKLFCPPLWSLFRPLFERRSDSHLRVLAASIHLKDGVLTIRAQLHPTETGYISVSLDDPSSSRAIRARAMDMAIHIGVTPEDAKSLVLIMVDWFVTCGNWGMVRGVFVDNQIDAIGFYEREYCEEVERGADMRLREWQPAHSYLKHWE